MCAPTPRWLADSRRLAREQTSKGWRQNVAFACAWAGRYFARRRPAVQGSGINAGGNGGMHTALGLGTWLAFTLDREDARFDGIIWLLDDVYKQWNHSWG
jgi:hypothetical protein